MTTTDQALDAANSMITAMRHVTQEEHQELAHLRAEVHRLQADSSKAIAALAECIAERDDLKSKLESTKSQMVELKRAFLSAENDVCAYRNKLAQVEAELAKEITLVDDMIDLRRRECDYTAKVEATAKRRLELLKAVDWCRSDCDCDQFRCFWCHGIKPKHDSDCPLAAELKEGK